MSEAFDGVTYQPELDFARLKTQLERVRSVMLRGEWQTLAGLKLICGGSEAGLSARLRDLKKEKNGSHKFDKRRVSSGLWEYRMKPKGDL